MIGIYKSPHSAFHVTHQEEKWRKDEISSFFCVLLNFSPPIQSHPLYTGLQQQLFGVVREAAVFVVAFLRERQRAKIYLQIESWEKMKMNRICAIFPCDVVVGESKWGRLIMGGIQSRRRRWWCWCCGEVWSCARHERRKGGRRWRRVDVKKFGAPEKPTTMTATQQTRKSFSPESTTSSNDTRHESMRVSSGWVGSPNSRVLRRREWERLWKLKTFSNDFLLALLFLYALLLLPLLCVFSSLFFSFSMSLPLPVFRPFSIYLDWIQPCKIDGCVLNTYIDIFFGERRWGAPREAEKQQQQKYQKCASARSCCVSCCRRLGLENVSICSLALLCAYFFFCFFAPRLDSHRLLRLSM